MENENEDLFDGSEDSEPLVNEPFSYDNIVNNPVIKPVAEADRSLRDLDEMNYKKLTDCNRDNKWVQSALLDAPVYSDSPFIARLIKIKETTSDIIKVQDIEINTLKNCLKEMVKIIRERYAVKVGDDETHTEPETVIPEESYENYLTKLSEHSDKTISTNSKNILEKYKVNKDQDLKRRFENSCSEVYKDETEKSNKKIIAKILRMEIN